MGKLQEFLMSNQDDIQATVEVAVSGFPVPFTIKSITEGENKAIRKSCQKITFDKKTHQKTTETDQDLYNNRLVIASVWTRTSKTRKLKRNSVSWAPILDRRPFEAWPVRRSSSGCPGSQRLF